MASSLITLFHSFRTILCICPCCGDIVRLSDLHLKYKGRVRRTWLDTYDSEIRSIETKESSFEEKERKLRAKAIERGRRKVPKIIQKSLDKKLVSFHFNPYDIKPLLHPVDFVVFNGLNSKETIEDIIFLSKKTTNANLNKLHKSIESTINKEKYNWQVARVSIEGRIKLE